MADHTVRTDVAATAAVLGSAGLAGVKAGIGALTLAAAGGAPWTATPPVDAPRPAVVLQLLLYLAVFAVVVAGARIGVGFAAAYVGYTVAATIARWPGTAWGVLVLATGLLLLASLLLLWVRVPRGPHRGPAVFGLFVAGSATGFAAALLVAAG